MSASPETPGTAEISIHNVTIDSMQVNINGGIKEIKNNLDESCLSHRHRKFFLLMKLIVLI